MAESGHATRTAPCCRLCLHLPLTDTARPQVAQRARHWPWRGLTGPSNRKTLDMTAPVTDGEQGQAEGSVRAAAEATATPHKACVLSTLPPPPCCTAAALAAPICALTGLVLHAPGKEGWGWEGGGRKEWGEGGTTVRQGTARYDTTRTGTASGTAARLVPERSSEELSRPSGVVFCLTVALSSQRPPRGQQAVTKCSHRPGDLSVRLSRPLPMHHPVRAEAPLCRLLAHSSQSRRELPAEASWNQKPASSGAELKTTQVVSGQQAVQ